ncbi:hypothetical protein L9F63_019842, partial [Diploptera punctata]
SSQTSSCHHILGPPTALVPFNYSLLDTTEKIAVAEDSLEESSTFNAGKSARPEPAFPYTNSMSVISFHV